MQPTNNIITVFLTPCIQHNVIFFLNKEGKKRRYLAYVFPATLLKEEASTKKREREIRSIKLKIHCAVHLFLPRLMSGKS